MRKEVIGDATLYCGDCLEILPTLGRVDHVIADPPYDKEAHTLQRRVRRGNEALNFEALNFEALNTIAEPIVAKSSGWVLAFCQAENVAQWRDALELSGAKYRRAMVWVKPDGMPQYSGDRPGMGYESIVASWAGSGGSKWNGGGRHGVFTHCKSGEWPKGAPHPTTKPLTLMRDLVSLFSSDGETILDPFMGSGTTGVAALQLGRKFIGIEIDPGYFDIACKRIEEAWRQPRLFEEPRKKPAPAPTFFDLPEHET